MDNFEEQTLTSGHQFVARAGEQRQDAGASWRDLVCLSHLRWDFVYQRPQHLLSRCARTRRVFFVEEPIFDKEPAPRLTLSIRDDGVRVVVPHLPAERSEAENNAAQRALINQLLLEQSINNYVLWYYTPMALAFTGHLQPRAIVYDCMDELSAFRGAPAVMREREARLLARANLVFTGGQTLYEAKRASHPNIHPFPSSIDRAHFAQARDFKADPTDQAGIAHPRLGFFGVIDERMDLALLDRIAQARPDWQLVMIGPIVKIDPAELPRHPNIHYLGGKRYEELPTYLAGWDVALLPFALNESTRFISPTKTPEYLAAGKPVVSTPIRDVVRPYGQMKLAYIAEPNDDFILAIETALNQTAQASNWLQRVDDFLARTSWDQTWLGMKELLETAVTGQQRAPKAALRSAAATNINSD